MEGWPTQKFGRGAPMNVGYQISNVVQLLGTPPLDPCFPGDNFGAFSLTQPVARPLNVAGGFAPDLHPPPLKISDLLLSNTFTTIPFSFTWCK